MKARLLALAAACAAPLVAIACGGGETSSTGTGGSTTSSTTSTTSSASSTTSSTSATTSSTSGTTSTTSSTSTTSTGSGGSPCTVGKTDCGVGSYCNAPGCTTTGTCAALGATEDPAKSPVCGCDGVTYWNASIAAKNAVSVSATGECTPGKACGGFANLQCPQGAVCDYRLPDASLCNVSDNAGTCWAMPSACVPGAGFGPNTRACGAAACADECGLIKMGALFYVDATCPQ